MRSGEALAGMRTKSRLAFLFKDSALYGGASVVSKAFGFITFPLLTRHFSIADYGFVNYFLVLAGLLATIFVFGQDSSVARYFYEHPEDASRKRLISQSLMIQVVGLAVFLPLLWGLSPWLAPRLYDSPQAPEVLKLVLWQVPFLVLINFSQNLLKWTFARGRFLALSLGSVALNLVFIVLGVRVLEVGVQGLFLLLLANNALFALLGLVFVRKWLVLKPGAAFSRDLLVFAAPYGVTCVLAAVVPLLERGAVERLLGAQELGYYAAGATVATVVTLLTSAFQMAWGPFSLAIHKEADAARTYNWILKGFALAICVCVLMLSGLGGPLITAMASERYSAATVVIFPLALGLGVQAVGWVTEIGISISKKTYLSLVGYGVFVGATVVGILLFGAFFGLFGVALGVLMGHVARSLFQTFMAQRAHPIGWAYGPVTILFLLTFSTGILARHFGASSASMSTAINISGAFMLLPASWFLFFNVSERSKILNVILKISGKTRSRKAGIFGP